MQEIERFARHLEADKKSRYTIKQYSFFVSHLINYIKKGPEDIISDGKHIVVNRIHNQGMTKGGTGDVLSGLVAALACKNDPFTAAVAGARINGYAGNMLRKSYGYDFSASDLADELAKGRERLYGKKR
jgi:NAD(P)H-hydrate repair Nnr-like enzyme with NAD(P)H-hydrate dehydratase domain